MVDMNQVVGSRDLLLLTLDTLRLDVAQRLHREGRTPCLSSHLPATGWEARHTTGSFTYAAHHAFFAGFLPVPAAPGLHPRPLALRFQGSETTGPETCVLEGASIVEGLAARGYHTVCVGGVGFFNQQNPLGRVLPGLFAERHWSPALGVTDPESTRNQVQLIEQILAALPPARRVFLFLNVSAIHQPNRCYLPGATVDSLESHAAALEYVDAQLGRLFASLGQRGPWHCIVCSDHGTAYGEEGYTGHRHAHPVIWNVPYAELALGSAAPRREP